jgi:hypothetical protein
MLYYDALDIAFVDLPLFIRPSRIFAITCLG